MRLDRWLYDMLTLFAFFQRISFLDKGLVALLALNSNQIQYRLLELMRVFFLTAVAKICFAYSLWNYSLNWLAFVYHFKVFLLLAESRGGLLIPYLLINISVVSSQQLVTDFYANRTPRHNVAF